LPECSGSQPVVGLALEMLAERLHSQLQQQRDAPALPCPGLARGPDGAVDRDGASVEVNLVSPERPELFRPQPGRHRQHDVGVEAGIRGSLQEFLSLL